MNAPASGARHHLQLLAERTMRQRGLQPSFSAAALAELSAITQAATSSEASIRDLRSLLWASIDNDDSRDLDQLSVSVPAAGGDVQVLVAIADVAAVVKKGSAIDEHASTNTTSVYTAGQVFPMLPEKLSTDLTSLGQDQERLAVVIEMLVRADGEVTTSEVYRARVTNHAKLAYNSVAAWLEGTGAAPERVASVAGLADQLRVQDRCAQAMKHLRHTRGSLNLETNEARAEFDGDVLTDLRSSEKNRATELIEEFMVAANTVTARFLEKKGLPSMRRVLKSPLRWERIVELAAELHESLPPQADGVALEAFLLKRRAADPARFADLSLAVVKLLGRGEYAVEVPGQKAEGHFGLALADYTHSTAPNRRFPDLITQRMLKAALFNEGAPYGVAELNQLALHCTAQEDNATRVERIVRKAAAALLLQSRIGERFAGIVTGASAKGTWVRIGKPPAEGKVVRGFEGFKVGDRVQVELLRTDADNGFIDFAGVTRS